MIIATQAEAEAVIAALEEFPATEANRYFLEGVRSWVNTGYVEFPARSVLVSLERHVP